MTTTPSLDTRAERQLLLTLKEYIDASTAWCSRAAVLESKGTSPVYPVTPRDKALRERFLRAEQALNKAIIGGRER